MQFDISNSPTLTLNNVVVERLWWTEKAEFLHSELSGVVFSTQSWYSNFADPVNLIIMPWNTAYFLIRWDVNWSKKWDYVRLSLDSDNFMFSSNWTAWGLFTDQAINWNFFRIENTIYVNF